MIVWFANVLIGRCIKQNIIREQEKEVYLFGLLGILDLALQIAVLFLLGIALNILLPVAIVALSFGPLKAACGGWHCNHYISCMIVSTTVVMAGVYLSPLLQYIPLGALLVYGLSVWVLLRYAPVEHPNNPVAAADKPAARRKIKVRVLLYATFIFLCVVFQYPLCAAYVVYSFAVTAVTLFIPNKTHDETDTNEQEDENG